MQLNPTKLGNKSHWDGVYEEEKENFDQFGDEGEVWFGQDSVDKMVCTVVEFHDRDQNPQQVEWAVKHVPPESNPKLLDIGTGNGILPICLVAAGYSPATICGIDYSQASIELAQRVAEGRSVNGLTFREVDFIKGNVERLPGRTNTNAEIRATASEEEWDLLLDKGTFDAMALYSASSPGGDAQQESKISENEDHPTNVYPSRVTTLLKTGGLFLVTSCNFTEKEIIAHFTEKEPRLKYHSRISHPQFTFGGKTGSVCCTVAFQKSADV